MAETELETGPIEDDVVVDIISTVVDTEDDDDQKSRLDNSLATDNHNSGRGITIVGLPTKTQQPAKAQLPTSREKKSSNELTKLIPGYTAPLKLDSSVLDPFRVGISELRKMAERTDPSTAAFVVGATADHAKAMWSSPSTAVGFVPPNVTAVYSSFKTGTKRPADNTAGNRWFGMAPTPMTDELKTDLAVIRNRNYLDPKRFYKSSDPMKGKVLQLGTVIEGPTEFFSARLSKKQRRANLTEEIMADPASANYAKNKFKAMQQAKSEISQKWKRKGKKGKRGY